MVTTISICLAQLKPVKKPVSYTHLTYIESGQFHPYKNLAVEEYLLLHCEPQECILYLWQNQNTVVIGRNQNAWKECKVDSLEENGGHLARRLSGGGAVYHDLGNLNFTFLVSKENYSIDRQLEVIVKAVQKLGAKAEKSGRNDILIDGKKFSGNAFYEQEQHCYHHGTLMMNVNKEMLSKYLTVSKEKLQSKEMCIRDRTGAEGASRNSQAKGTGLDNTLENNGRDCTEEVTYLPYTRRPVSNLSGERTEADKK